MSRPPEHPGSPSDPQGGNSDPGGHQPPGYGPPPEPQPDYQWQRGYAPPPAPQPDYGPPPPGYPGPPPPPGYAPPPAPQPDYGPPPPGYPGPPPPPGYAPPPAPPPGYDPHHQWQPGYDPHHQWHPGYTPPPAPLPDYAPPPPGYAGPPPPPGYAAPPPDQEPPTDQPFNVADGFSWAWHAFSKNATALIVPTLAYLVAFGVIGAMLFGRLSSHAGGFGGIGLTAIGLFYLVIIPAGIFMQAAFLSGCLDIADGKPVTISSFFHPRHVGRVTLSALLVIVVTSIGNILCGFPGLIFSFFALFTIAFATDRALPPVEALNASITTVKSNTRGALLSWLVQVLVLAIGALLCGVGMLVAFPVATLVQTYTCRRLSGGTIAPLSQ